MTRPSDPIAACRAELEREVAARVLSGLHGIPGHEGTPLDCVLRDRGHWLRRRYLRRGVRFFRYEGVGASQIRIRETIRGLRGGNGLELVLESGRIAGLRVLLLGIMYGSVVDAPADPPEREAEP